MLDPSVRPYRMEARAITQTNRHCDAQARLTISYTYNSSTPALNGSSVLMNLINYRQRHSFLLLMSIPIDTTNREESAQ